MRPWLERQAPLLLVLIALAVVTLGIALAGITGTGEGLFYGIQGYPDWVYQATHFTVSFLVVSAICVAAVASRKRWPESAPLVIPLGTAFWIGFALVKEAVLDPYVEGNPFYVPGQFFQTGLEDFTFYVVGAIAALALAYALDEPKRAGD